MISLPVPPGLALPPPHSILKKTSAYAAVPAKPKKPPGVPPGPPPELSDDDEEQPMDQDGKKCCNLMLGVHGASTSSCPHLATFMVSLHGNIYDIFIIYLEYPCLILLF
jgi:hypothetical protein